LSDFAGLVRGVLDRLVTTRESPDHHELLDELTCRGAAALLVIGSERGLCGAFNEHLVRRIATLLAPDTC
jgi:F0F1-type ATP synthase gamma subunit